MPLHSNPHSSHPSAGEHIQREAQPSCTGRVQHADRSRPLKRLLPPWGCTKQRSNLAKKPRLNRGTSLLSKPASTTTGQAVAGDGTRTEGSGQQSRVQESARHRQLRSAPTTSSGSRGSLASRPTSRLVSELHPPLHCPDPQPQSLAQCIQEASTQHNQQEAPESAQQAPSVQPAQEAASHHVQQTVMRRGALQNLDQTFSAEHNVMRHQVSQALTSEQAQQTQQAQHELVAQLEKQGVALQSSILLATHTHVPLATCCALTALATSPMYRTHHKTSSRSPSCSSLALCLADQRPATRSRPAATGSPQQELSTATSGKPTLLAVQLSSQVAPVPPAAAAMVGPDCEVSAPVAASIADHQTQPKVPLQNAPKQQQAVNLLLQGQVQSADYRAPAAPSDSRTTLTSPAVAPVVQSETTARCDGLAAAAAAAAAAHNNASPTLAASPDQSPAAGSVRTPESMAAHSTEPDSAAHSLQPAHAAGSGPVLPPLRPAPPPAGPEDLLSGAVEESTAEGDMPAALRVLMSTEMLPGIGQVVEALITEADVLSVDPLAKQADLPVALQTPKTAQRLTNGIQSPDSQAHGPIAQAAVLPVTPQEVNQPSNIPVPTVRQAAVLSKQALTPSVHDPVDTGTRQVQMLHAAPQLSPVASNKKPRLTAGWASSRSLMSLSDAHCHCLSRACLCFAVVGRVVCSIAALTNRF